MTTPVRLYNHEGLTVTRHQEGFCISLWSGAGVTSKMIPFAEGDKLAICFRPGFDPIRDDVEEIIHNEEPPHPDD